MLGFEKEEVTAGHTLLDMVCITTATTGTKSSFRGSDRCVVEKAFHRDVHGAGTWSWWLYGLDCVRLLKGRACWPGFQFEALEGRAQLVCG